MGTELYRTFNGRLGGYQRAGYIVYLTNSGKLALEYQTAWDESMEWLELIDPDEEFNELTEWNMRLCRRLAERLGRDESASAYKH